MKKIKNILLLSLCTLLLSGCMKFNMSITVDKNGNTSLATEILVSEDLIKTTQQTKESYLKSLKEQYQNENVTIKEISKKDKDGTNYIGISAVSNNNKSSLKAVKKDGRISLSIPVKDLTDSLNNKDFNDAMKTYNYSFGQLKKLGVQMIITITMPSSPKTNIGKVSGNTVTIDLLDELSKDSNNQIQTIEISSSANDYRYYYYIAGGIVIIGVIGAIIMLIRKKRKPLKEA